MIKISGLAVCLSMWLAHSDALAAGCKLAYVSEIPMTLQGDRLVVQVAINGHAAKLILDTGAFMSTLSQPDAVRFGLRVQPDTGSRFSHNEVTGVDGSRDFGFMEARSLQLGRLTGQDIRFAVPNSFRNHDAGEDPDLLGMNTLTKFDTNVLLDLDLDILGQRLVLFESDELCTRPRVLMGQPLYTVPLIDDVHRNNILFPVTIQGHTLTAALDTGAPHSMLTRAAASRLGITDEALAADRVVQGTGMAGQRIPISVHATGPMQIGDLTVANLKVGIVDQGSLLDSDMLVGMDFIRHVHIWISNASRMLIIQVPPTPSPAIPASLTSDH